MEMSDLIKKLEKLNASGLAMSKILDPDKLYDVILDQLRENFNFESSAILLYGKDGETLTIKAARGYDPETVKTFKGRKGVGITGQALERQEPVLVTDVKSESRYVVGVKGAASELAAPLLVNGQTIGVLDIENTRSDAFNELDLHLFNMFTTQAASAIRSAQFVQEIEAKAERLAIVNMIGQVLSIEHDPEIIMEKILGYAKEALNFSRCALLLIDDEEGDTLRINASMGYGEVNGMRIKIGEGVTGEAAQTGLPILVPDVEKDRRYIKGVTGGKCEICAPLTIKGEVVGVLDAESKDVGGFTDADLELLSIFASNAAIAIHNAKLFGELERANRKLVLNIKEMEKLNRELDAYVKQIAATNEALQKQVKQLTTLHKAGMTITSSLDLDTTLMRIVDMVSDLVEASATTIRLVDRETSEMKVRIKVGDDKMAGRQSKFDVPLKIGEKTIGMFELASGREMETEERRLLETLAMQAAVAIENARLFEETQKTYYETLKSLATALEARDAYTQGHSERVAGLSIEIAKKMEIPEEERKEIYSVALLHDIGKIGVRDEILLKPDALTADEWKIIQGHPVFGDAILTPLKFLSKVAGMVKHHHERWDGAGYPSKLKGEEIPIASRIVAAADTFDALTSDRPYRDRKTKEEAVSIIKAEAGKQFDPRIVDALLKAIGERQPTHG